MSRLNRTVEVVLRRREGGGTEPAAFVWEGRRYQVEGIQAIWKATGRWWDGEGERTFFRVAAALAGVPTRRAPRGIYELCYRERTEEWLLTQIED